MYHDDDYSTPNGRREGCRILILISILIWLLVLSSCSVLNGSYISQSKYVHSGNELIVLSVDRANGTVLLQGIMEKPKGMLYYVSYSIEEVGFVNEKDILKINFEKK